MPTLSSFKKSVKKFMESSKILRPLLYSYMAHNGNRRFRLAQKNCFRELLKRNNINVVLDIGAHAGETGKYFRNGLHFSGRIISFEPIHEKFLALQQKTHLDPLWKCHEVALGNEHGTKTLTVFNNAYNSSFLDIHELLEKEGKLQKMREEKVQIRRLDSLYPSLCNPSDSVLLKIDTQGFEKPILDGADKCLRHVRLVKMEVSFVPLYQGETLIGEMIQFMGSKGFVPVLIEPGHISEEFYQLQADIVFHNQNPTIGSFT
ncbi:MAG TPA: FkbM family methyltransferase [Chlamydiales bacterium]|jgi:FkbM family methyltransferase